MIDGFVWRVPAKVKRVIDGDTVVLHELDLGFWHAHAALEDQDEHVRLADLWCPETRSKDPVEKAAGIAAREYARLLLPDGATVVYHSRVWDRTLERVLGSIELLDGRDFAATMISAGHGTATKEG